MRFYKQLFLHDPEKGVWGDCWRTAIGCLLDLRPEDVPLHWHEDIEGDVQNDRTRAWLAQRGLCLISFAYWGPGSKVAEPMSMEEVLAHIAHFHKGIHHLFSGTSRSNADHVVVARDGEIVHDPSRVESGIVGPCGDGLWWVNFIGKLT